MRKFISLIILTVCIWGAFGCTLKRSVLFGERNEALSNEERDTIKIATGFTLGSLKIPNKKEILQTLKDSTNKLDSEITENTKESNIEVNSSHVIKVFIDREGILYPHNSFIPNIMLKENDYSFMPTEYRGYKKDTWHYGQYRIKDNLSLLPEQKKLYDIANGFTNTDDQLLLLRKQFDFRQQFNTPTVESLVRTINKLCKEGGYTSVTFLIVGFNNTYANEDNYINSSMAKHKLQREKILDIQNHHNYLQTIEYCHSSNLIPDTLKASKKLKKTLFVEVHWDGKFTAKQGLATSLIYLPALVTACKSGLALRRILQGIDSDTTNQNNKLEINLFSHSSGAYLVCGALFNQTTRFSYSYSKPRQRKLKEYLKFAYEDTATYKTPNNLPITAFLLEPALPGRETFVDFGKRIYGTGELQLNGKSFDNYNVAIGYNINDPVLRKQFKTVPVVDQIIHFFNRKDQLIRRFPGGLFGATSLGCIREDVNDLKKLFEQRYSVQQFKDYDFSFVESEDGKSKYPLREHDALSYYGLRKYSEAIREIYGFER